MSSGHGGIVGTLPDDLREWVRSHAEDRGIAEEDLVREILTIYRLITEDPQLETALAADAVDAADRYMALIEDVRERVIQVKRESDAKAPMDHDHPDLTGSIESLERRLEGGFDNFESILAEFDAALERLEDQVDTIASGLVVNRRMMNEMRSSHRTRTTVDAIRHSAATTGSQSARCEGCGSKVNVALMTEPFCPHCERAVSDVVARSGFLRSNLLTVADQPALVGETAEPDDGAMSSANGDESEDR